MNRASPLNETFSEWWEKSIDKDDGQAKADRAALCRLGVADQVFPPAIDVAGALTIGAFRTLYRQINQREILKDFRTGDWEDRLAVAAMVLAQVRTNTPSHTTAALLGGDDDTPLMAESRFRRLLRAKDPVDLWAQARRAVALLKREAPVGDLGASLFTWDAHTRRRWAGAYWRLQAPAEDQSAPSAAVLSPTPLSTLGAP
ncbi:type I-E CRISPR-associated protein Cse2/CasB [Rhodospirillum rubrum]|uniref:CRISPR-associated protein, Cse2 family n=1 Tax=Rhodospirillum rubrum (strain ATCC 11170 / ATH 1.1.1 / DSM 467 / LMG 4362 / NCIMB 8255 / S1) TaxID=269796 RepID=Q2RY17_RHORT|nr:type I-E CRISPR-associated protein Cse2/CasB [Rhodospirillum rubrum]ABC20978.1 CRISPR-associated protein, Cse2 family [Rhodospirillum rubrum ATCC 11170]AEO46643.1 CRISPR-associated Cse2 family protein [Rhodospirillum rubrum F11]MBK5952532.1 CRISPR-associated protein Cse2 [Rhodospirillum rubrum]QXG80675.1 type I-E CRISPR-associated protein Cse2/CasB [Rhodospirillum rubrum]HAP98607.1 CRISPR-associated protein Cse2 [Rhodospirillum rubrum]